MRLATLVASAAATLPLLNASAEAPRVLLGAPLVQKIDWDMRSAVAADLDADGRADVAVLNNDESRIDILLQRTPEELRKATKEKVDNDFWDPIVDTAPFLEENVLIGDKLFALAVTDFDQDGKADLVFTGQRDPLSIRFGDEDMRWEEGWVYDQSKATPADTCLAVADVDGDGDQDIAVLAESEFLLFRGGVGRSIPKPDIYRVSSTGAKALRLIDLDADGQLDACYLQPGSDRTRVVRFGLGEGNFGAEVELPGKLGAEDWAVVQGAPGDLPSLATVKGTFAEITVANLEKAGVAGAANETLQANNYPVPRSGSSAALPAAGDFNGDGIADVAMADPDGARVLVWLGNRNFSYQRPLEYPALAGATSLSPVRHADTDKDSLLICSITEGFAGISAIDDRGRLSFPKPLPLEGEPLVAAGTDLDGDGNDEIVVAIKDGLRLEAAILSNSNGEWTIVETVKIGSIKRNPEHIYAADLDGDGDGDVAILLPREPAHLLLSDGAGSLTIGAEDSPIRTGQFTDITPAELGLGDMDGDGLPEILLAKSGFVRAFRLTAEGDLEVVDQGNARQGQDTAKGPVVVPSIGDETPTRLLFYDPGSESIQVLEKAEDDAFRYARSLETGEIQVTRSLLLPPRDGAQQMLVFGRDRFWVLPLAGETWVTAKGETFRSRVDDIGFNHLCTGDLNSDGIDEIVAVDGNQNILQILKTDDGKWTSSMHFKVFQKSPFQASRKKGPPIQPHGLLIDDFTGDGLNDLIAFCHNRLLLYPGKKAKEDK